MKQTNKLELSIEEKLFKDNPVELFNIKNLNTDNFTDFNKIPELFSRLNGDNREGLNEAIESKNGWFVDIINDKRLTLRDLIEQSNSKFVTKTNGFVLESDRFCAILKYCKKHETKLTGCLNTITALATFKLYKSHMPNNVDLYDIIQYHCLVNLRPFLQPPLDNLASGYWATVFNCELNTKDLTKIDSSTFWKLAKCESDSIHTRISNKEHFESAKLDTALLIDIENEFQNGSTHFALSNLGSMTTESKNFIEIDEHYFGTSCQAKRWTSLIFHGLCTINNRLCWSITYNSELIRDEIVEELIQNLNEIIDEIIL
jgi:hypothetical protein